MLAIDDKDAMGGERDARMTKGYPWNPSADYMPLGALLQRGHREAIGLSVKARRGAAWVCTSGEASGCGVRKTKVFDFTGVTPRLTLDPGAAGESGWSGTLYLEELTASTPAKLPAAGIPSHP